jgi:uncharacterized protein (DUF1499 family)
MRGIIGVLIIIAAGAGLAGCAKSPVGIYGNCLMPCPASPNCVSSCEKNADRFVAPIDYMVPRQNAREAVIRIIGDFPRTRIVTARDNYIHVEFRSRVFRFVDDVEFFFDEEKPLIHVRSASRVGFSDLGVNRKRVETIRERFRRIFPVIPDTAIAK